MTRTANTKETTVNLDTRAAQAAHDELQAAAYAALANAQGRVAQLERTAANTEGWMARHAERAAADLPAARERAAEARTAYDALAAKYTGWSRFYLVTNGNGHVHSSLHCTTCYATTTYGWLTALSGATEDEAVEEYGEKMCTVCYPSAPADERYRRPGRIDREAAEAKRAEKDAKAAAKAAKAITAVDGGPLKDGLGYTLNTLRAAEIELTNLYENMHGYAGTQYGSDNSPARNRIAEAIALKTGRTPAEVHEVHNAKGAKKAAKWGN